MKTFRILTMILFFLLPVLFIQSPVITPTYAGGGSVKVELPIDEIRSLIDQLEEAGSGITGQAGIEMRASIDKLSSELEARLDQIEEMSKELWGMMIKDLDMELNLILTSVQDYLDQVNQMAEERITQISQELALRIDQISDEVEDRLNQVDRIAKEVIEAAKDGAIEVVDHGRTSVLIVVDSMTKKFVKVAIIILDIILLLLIGISAWKGKMPTKPGQKTVVIIVLLIFFGVSSLFLFSNKVMAGVLGKDIELANTEEAKEEADQGAADFAGAVASGRPSAYVKEIGLAAISRLKQYEYLAESEAEAEKAREKINKIQAVINPPPSPASTVSGGSVMLGKSSKYYNLRVNSLKSAARELNVAPRILYRTLQPIRLDQPVVSPELIHPR